MLGLLWISPIGTSWLVEPASEEASVSIQQLLVSTHILFGSSIEWLRALIVVLVREILRWVFDQLDLVSRQHNVQLLCLQFELHNVVVGEGNSTSEALVITWFDHHVASLELLILEFSVLDSTIKGLVVRFLGRHEEVFSSQDYISRVNGIVPISVLQLMAVVKPHVESIPVECFYLCYSTLQQKLFKPFTNTFKLLLGSSILIIERVERMLFSRSSTNRFFFLYKA